jgi:DNA replication and repair protein RecF
MGDLRTLDVWDGHLADHGAVLLAARMELVDALRPYAEEVYSRIAPEARGNATASPFELRYVSSIDGALPGDEGGALKVSNIPDVAVLSAVLLSELARVRPQELERGVTLIGPHRDDVDLSLNGLPLRGYASHGEGWSAALALRLACYDLLSSDGAEPVLILDDVFAELDTERRIQLASIAAKAEQVLISSAVVEDVPEQLIGARYDVADGEVRRVR